MPATGWPVQGYPCQYKHPSMQKHAYPVADKYPVNGYHQGQGNAPQGFSRYQGGSKQVVMIGKWLKGPDGESVMMPDEVKVKDPAVRGNVLYDVPSDKVETTYGLWEYLDGQAKGGVHRTQCHRATLCKLFLEGRCGQGSKCKSFHIDAGFVHSKRKECNVEFDESFLTEVAVETFDGTIAAVRYKSIGRTKGLDAYKTALPNMKVVTPAKLCYNYCTHMVCDKDRACDMIHVKPLDLKESIRRTPCCYSHGDLAMASIGRCLDEVVEVKKGNGTGSWVLPLYSIAMTAGGTKRLRGAMTVADICSMHVKSRCKFGRGCDRVHVCRAWAFNVGLSALLASRPAPPSGKFSQGGTPVSSYLSTPQTGNLSPGNLSIKSHPPSPSAYSLLSSENDTYQEPPLTNTSFSSSSRRLSAFPTFTEEAEDSQSSADVVPDLNDALFLQLIGEE
eukprot:TRINITY_DN5526_c0_g1_i1.p1 TRINITY_DN5526_c0_g1~~TRINITY_DN5526_c0_g1_i1.p1  ORF type:complete len:467 (+),score=77.56 TRINITY_DN5526_c0_g1_i1:61-1401(+)